MDRIITASRAAKRAAATTGRPQRRDEGPVHGSDHAPPLRVYSRTLAQSAAPSPGYFLIPPRYY
jgi:hypothetical protein